MKVEILMGRQQFRFKSTRTPGEKGIEFISVPLDSPLPILVDGVELCSDTRLLPETHENEGQNHYEKLHANYVAHSFEACTRFLAINQGYHVLAMVKVPDNTNVRWNDWDEILPSNDEFNRWRREAMADHQPITV